MLSRKTGITLVMALLCLLPSVAGTGRYRAMWRDNPSTTTVIGWDQQSGSSPTIYYDTVDHGTNTANYAYSQGPDRSVSYKGMSNQFARLSGLQPDTVYYFVIADSDSTSARMLFQTAAADQSSFTVIAGGDSRNNWDIRINANRMVAKLKPGFVMFGGDMTSGDSSSEWQAWMDHWQETITSEGRLIPIVAARGNHEGSNASISNLFDSPNSSIYFALTFGNNMLRTYTLNSEDVEGGNQASWLQSDLANNQNVNWRFAQYHKPMRPHVSSKSEGNSEYNAWAQHFYDYQVQLVVECDSHMVKSTWPVRPSSQSGSDEGFIRDDENGTVYVGEGTWGAPLRSANDNKAWTRESGSFNQFKWMEVSASQVQIKTVQYGNVSSVGEVNATNAFTPPSGLQTWGSTIVLSASSAPSVNLTSPSEGTLFQVGDSVQLSADASSSAGTIVAVRFEVDGQTIATDNSAPYTASWTASGNGNHTITAIATDDINQTASDSRTIQVGVATISRQIASGSDDAEEKSGAIDLTSSDLELIRETSDQLVGMRFTNLSIPQGAEISEAYIQFTCDETSSETTNLIIRGEDSGNASTFTTASNNISNRNTTAASASWSPAAWNSVGQSGSAQRSTDLSAIVEEIVSRGDWNAGNAMVFIADGSGRRTAESFNGVSSSSPILTVTYSNGGGGQSNIDPVANFSSSTNDLTVSFSNTSSDSDGSIVSQQWTFGDGTSSSAQNPSHTYTSSGSYNVTLRVTDNDGASDSITKSVTVTDPGNGGTPITISRRVATGSDDAEEKNGSVGLTSTDLELIRESTQQLVGIRFTALNIPQAATITDARIQFTVDETSSETTNLIIRGQATGHASGFSTSSNNISNRATTAASANWSPAAWNSVGAAGNDQQTTNLNAIVQEIVNRQDWQSGNAMVFLVDGTGKRVAESYNGSSANAPLLTITYTSDGSGGGGPSLCPGGDTLSNLSANAGAWTTYTVDVPDCSTTFTATITGGSGDADLYVRFGSEATSGTYDCRPYRWGNEESCSISNPSAGTWYISLDAYDAYSGLNLTTSY